MVLEKAVLFICSIIENLKWGYVMGSDDEISFALENAQAAEIVAGKEGGLDYMIEQSGRNLSGGQKQRTALARMLACEPEVILMDEPFSALDEYLREQMQDELSNMLTMLNKPAILVSHSSKEVENLCDKKYHIQRGHLKEVAL